jgi:NADPH-dependent curcumin reductase CurA
MALPTKIKGITVEKPGAPAQLSTDLDVPEPSDTQILVKSIYTAVNPVYISLPLYLFPAIPAFLFL